MGIGNILSTLIQQQGTNVNKLAQAADVSPQTLYSMIRRDNMKVNVEVLIRVCRALNVPVEYVYELYSGERTKTAPKYTPQEITLITKYRALDDADRELVDNIIDNLHERRLSKLSEKSAETMSD